MPTLTPSPATLLDQATEHLARAADHVAPTDPALAGQIRLAAATLPLALPPTPTERTAPAGPTDDGRALVPAPGGVDGTDAHNPGASDDVTSLLEEALNCLDQIPPLHGPADLQLCAWHLNELHRIATARRSS